MKRRNTRKLALPWHGLDWHIGICHWHGIGICHWHGLALPFRIHNWHWHQYWHRKDLVCRRCSSCHSLHGHCRLSTVPMYKCRVTFRNNRSPFWCVRGILCARFETTKTIAVPRYEVPVTTRVHVYRPASRYGFWLYFVTVQVGVHYDILL